MQKKFRKCFLFWDKCIWKCCEKFPLLRREYLSSTVNGLTSSPKILHITKTDLQSWFAFTGINRYGKGAIVQLWRVFRPVYRVTCLRILVKQTFSTFDWPRFPESLSSKIHMIWVSYLFGKCPKLNLCLKNPKKNLKKFSFLRNLHLKMLQ